MFSLLSPCARSIMAGRPSFRGALSSLWLEARDPARRREASDGPGNRLTVFAAGAARRVSRRRGIGRWTLPGASAGRRPRRRSDSAASRPCWFRVTIEAVSSASSSGRMWPGRCGVSGSSTGLRIGSAAVREGDRGSRSDRSDAIRQRTMRHRQFRRGSSTLDGGRLGRSDQGFAMEWETYADKARQLKAITDESKKADTLILAADPDRHGEARGRRDSAV